MPSVACRPRHNVSSRRNRHKVANTHTVSVGGWPGPSSRVGSHQSITRAISSKMLWFNAALLVTEQQIKPEAAMTKARPIQPQVAMKIAF